MAIISIDLALKRYDDIGVAVLEKHGDGIEVSCVSLREAGLSDPPDPDTCAAFIAEFADELGVRVVLLDGPQGWKSPDKGSSTPGCANASSTRRPRRDSPAR